jgi:TonB family protein
MRQRSRTLWATAVTLAVLLGTSATARADDFLQHFRDQYQGKTFLLRGFYTGDKLRYDATGALIGSAIPGDWTTDGVIQLSEIDITHDHLTIKARRLLISTSKGTFHFLVEDPKKQKKGPPLKILADLDSPNPSPEQAKALMSRILLTPEDDLADQVPDYWKPCLRSRFVGKDPRCQFSPDLLSIPGTAPSAEMSSRSLPTSASDPASSKGASFKIGHGVSPPRVISQHEPAFSEPARQAKYEGVVTLALTVDKEGVPTNIRVTEPLGCGLDAKAVEAVGTWRFNPAEKDGHPVSVAIAVEVVFHLY